MKTILAILMSCVLISGVQAQDDSKLSKSEIRQLKREQRKAEQADMDAKLSEMTKWMIENRNFVLEADFLSDQYGTRYSVSSNINFIMVDSADATLQLGSAFSAGYNGVGGTTVDGRISKFEVTPVGKNQNSWNISMIFRSAQGNYDISLMVSPTGYADASIRGNWSGELNYHGNMVPIAQAKIFKGSPML